MTRIKLSREMLVNLAQEHLRLDWTVRSLQLVNFILEFGHSDNIIAREFLTWVERQSDLRWVDLEPHTTELVAEFADEKQATLFLLRWT